MTVTPLLAAAVDVFGAAKYLLAETGARVTDLARVAGSARAIGSACVTGPPCGSRCGIG